MGINDQRQETSELFSELCDVEKEQLARDAWSIGLRALSNAYRHAQESRLEDVGRTLLNEMDSHLKSQLEHQSRTLKSALTQFFDPNDGEVTRRLSAFVADEGVLARFLGKYVGADQSVLANTLAAHVGANSDLLKKLSPTERDGVVQLLETRMASVLQDNQQQLFKALDPLAEDGAVARLLRALRSELEGAEQNRTAQLNKAVAALDANDETSLISRLAKETSDAKQTLLNALNPQDPQSPPAAVGKTVETMLAKHGQTQKELLETQQERQKELEASIRETIARLDARKQADAVSPRGGLDFEAAVVRFIEDAVRDGPYIVEATGNTTGKKRGCKVGDVVVQFTDESAFSGCRIVVEAKRDNSYTVAKALEEMETACENREARIGVFVFAATHAPPGLPDFVRYGRTILVSWDAEDPARDPLLRGALMAAMAMVTRQKHTANESDLKALSDIENCINKEIRRVSKMRKANENIAKSSEQINDELRKAERAFDRLLSKAKSTLQALDVELDPHEVQEPISLPVPAPRAEPLRASSAK